MNSDDLLAAHKYPRFTTERYKRLSFYWKVLHRQQYDCLLHPFSKETDSTDKHIPLRQRRPAVRFNLAKIIVSKSVSMCYSGRSWPQISSDNEDFTQWLIAFYDIFNFSAFTSRVATYGSIGSVVPIFRFEMVEDAVTGEKRGRIAFDVWNARDCEPEFNPDGSLRTVMLKYLTTAANLRNLGIEPGRDERPNSKWWYRRRLTSQEDIIYVPTSQGDWDDTRVQLRPLASHTYSHGLGFVPAEWVINLPADEDDSFDGACTFSEIIDFIIEIDYTLSQCGRGLRYNSDPTLLLKEPISNEDGDPLARSTAKLLEVGAQGDGKLLEMQGNGQKVAIEYVEKLRNLALEVVRGSRKDPQRALSHASSGKMAEMLEDDLISLAAEVRASYDKGFLIPFTIKIVLACKKHGLGGEVIQALDIPTLRSIRTARGQWFEPTSTDHVQLQDSLDKAVSSGRLHIKDARQITYHAHDRLVPQDADWDENLEHIARVEKAKNEWRIELARMQALASAGIAEENDRAAEEAAAANNNKAEGAESVKPEPNLEAIQESIETAFPKMDEDGAGSDDDTRSTGKPVQIEDIYSPGSPL